MIRIGAELNFLYNINLSVAVVVLCLLSSPQSHAQTDPTTTFYSLPFAFEENRGQAESPAVFVGRAAAYTAVFSRDSVTFHMPVAGAKGNQQECVFRMNFLGSIVLQES